MERHCKQKKKKKILALGYSGAAESKTQKLNHQQRTFLTT